LPRKKSNIFPIVTFPSSTNPNKNRMMRNICLLAFVLLFAGCNTAPAQNKLQFSIPFTLVDNRPFIEVKIQNKTLHFILDCGATDVIDVTTARSLHLKLENETTTSGAGAKRMPAWETTVDTTRIGKATILKENFNVVDLSEIKNKLHLPYLDGAIGYNFMKDYIVQFDYPNHTVNFYSAYAGIGGIPFSMYYHIPKLKTTIDGKSATLIMDTGDRTTLTVFNHYAESSGIKKRYILSDTSITGYGIGGPIYARTFTLKQIGIGKQLIADVPSRIPMLKTGGFADTQIDGSIGGGILKRFKFTIDYKKSLLYLE
jgi:predicted aspartyl protease